MMRTRRIAILLAGALAGCTGTASGPPATGSGGTSSGGTSAGGSGGGGGSGGSAAGSAGTGGTVGTGGTAGTVTTGGTGGTVGGGGNGGGGTGGTAGGAGTGTGGTATGQGGRGGTGGRGGAGGSGGTSGAVGTGGTSGGGGGGGAASGCAGKTYKLCEDFETGNVGAIPPNWNALNGFGTDSMKGVGLATDQFHSGAMALKSSSVVPGEQRVQHSLSALGATATKHWGRIFYKVISPSPKPASGSVIHVTMVALQGSSGNPENRVVDTVEQSNGTHQWIFNIPDDSCCTGSNYNWSFDANWHCAEWYVDVSTQSYRFFTDGTEVTMIGFTGKAAAKMSSYPSIGVGTIFYQPPPSPFTIWFDDLAIDDNQIGCQ